MKISPSQNKLAEAVTRRNARKPTVGPGAKIRGKSEDYYVASVASLPGCHTQARSFDALMERIREAIELYLEVEGGNSESLDFIGVQRVTIAA
jgi:predicted RNase H-like HicB family nuclease